MQRTYIFNIEDMTKLAENGLLESYNAMKTFQVLKECKLIPKIDRYDFLCLIDYIFYQTPLPEGLFINEKGHIIKIT